MYKVLEQNAEDYTEFQTKRKMDKITWKKFYS